MQGRENIDVAILSRRRDERKMAFRWENASRAGSRNGNDGNSGNRENVGECLCSLKKSRKKVCDRRVKLSALDIKGCQSEVRIRN